MEIYKVWSMSADSKKSNYRLEHEARVSASNRLEAIKKARQALGENRKNEFMDSWSWMATRLP